MFTSVLSKIDTVENAAQKKRKNFKQSTVTIYSI